MPTIPPVVREDRVGSWAEIKHRSLGDYLTEYAKIMRRQPWCLGYEYIDAFAGTGRPRLREEQRYIDGSPRVALSIPYPFTRYTFIEMAKWRIPHLERLRSEFPDRTIDIIHGDCNEAITSHITPRIRKEYQRRGIILLDPFGANLDFATIEEIAATKALEIFLNFPTMALNRAALHNRPDALTAQTVALMDRIWGSREWRALLFEQRLGLLGTMEVKKRSTPAWYLGELFVEHRLKPLFRHVTDPIVMKNSMGGDLYCLIFAGHNPTGAKIANHIFHRDERHARQIRFASPPSFVHRDGRHSQQSQIAATLPLWGWDSE